MVKYFNLPLLEENNFPQCGWINGYLQGIGVNPEKIERLQTILVN